MRAGAKDLRPGITLSGFRPKSLLFWLRDLNLVS